MHLASFSFQRGAHLKISIHVRENSSPGKLTLRRPRGHCPRGGGGGGGGGGGKPTPPPPPPPHKIILSLFFLEDKTLAPDVFSTCSFIPRAYFETSLVIVRCYGYKIWRHKYKVVKPFLGENVCFFQLLSTIKANLVAKIVQSAYLYVTFYVTHKKITISNGFNLISNLEKLA